MNPKNLLYVNNRHDWHKWLKENHKNEREIWLVYYKKHTGQDRIPYDDAVEEALCFGWIDSIVRRLDDERFAQKFTPRKDSSNWSESNKRRIRKLITLGKMSDQGMLKVEKAKESGKWDKSINISIEDNIHPDFKKALENNPKVKENFDNLAPSYRKQFIAWISLAKRDETRSKRIRESLDLLSKNQKLGLKIGRIKIHLKHW